jgi:hypothetical protein
MLRMPCHRHLEKALLSVSCPLFQAPMQQQCRDVPVKRVSASHGLKRVAGRSSVMKAVTSPAHGDNDACEELLTAYHDIHAIHMDYIMRCHVTNWFGPTASFPGGWCRCFRLQQVCHCSCSCGPCMCAWIRNDAMLYSMCRWRNNTSVLVNAIPESWATPEKSPSQGFLMQIAKQ